VQAYLEPIRRTISCITQAKVKAYTPPSGLSPQRARDEVFPLVLADGEPVSLKARSGSPRFAFSMRQQYKLEHHPDDPNRGPWKVVTLDYEYAVYTDTRDGAKELVTYHFHPSSKMSRVKRPHLHLRSAAGVMPVLEAGHYPTGRVALEEVVWMLLDDRDNQFGVQPLRRNWRAVLQEGLDAFERWRTWPTGGAPSHPLT
ncbi:MAG TPA: hypothetical protein VGW38_19010, partial [Chloroflexota bacterium]|nr:hypothetical protein [Chloroflexota bacterium]